MQDANATSAADGGVAPPGPPPLPADSPPTDGGAPPAGPAPPAAAAKAAGAPGRHVVPRPPLTHFFTPTGDKVFRLHETDVALVRPTGEVLLNSGGWVTLQTLRAINMALRACLPGVHVVADGPVANGAWKVTNGRGFAAPFFDGMLLVGGTQADEQPYHHARAGLGGGYGRGGGFGGGRGGAGGRGVGRGAGRGGGGGPPAKGAGRLSEAEVERLFERAAAAAAASDAEHAAAAAADAAERPGGEGGADAGGGEAGTEGGAEGGCGGGAKIDFAKYAQIPVDVSGEDAPPPIASFAEAGLHPQLVENLSRARYSQVRALDAFPTPPAPAGRPSVVCPSVVRPSARARPRPALHWPSCCPPRPLKTDRLPHRPRLMPASHSPALARSVL